MARTVTSALRVDLSKVKQTNEDEQKVWSERKTAQTI